MSVELVFIPIKTVVCRVQRHPFERIATPFQLYSWTAPQVDHAMDCVRAEDAYTSRLGYEEHIPGQARRAVTSAAPPLPSTNANTCRRIKSVLNWIFQTRDWNEELQTTRELPRKNLPERLLRERAIFKVPPSAFAACVLPHHNFVVPHSDNKGIQLNSIKFNSINRPSLTSC